MLADFDIFSKQLGIFGPNFTHLLHVPIYARPVFFPVNYKKAKLTQGHHSKMAISRHLL